MLEHKHTTTITQISSLFTVLESKGIDKETFLTDAGVDPSVLQSPENRLTWETLQMLNHRAVQATGNSYFDLHQDRRWLDFQIYWVI